MDGRERRMRQSALRVIATAAAATLPLLSPVASIGKVVNPETLEPHLGPGTTATPLIGAEAEQSLRDVLASKVNPDYILRKQQLAGTGLN
jgi:hypothetical protein